MDHIWVKFEYRGRQVKVIERKMVFFLLSGNHLHLFI